MTDALEGDRLEQVSAARSRDVRAEVEDHFGLKQEYWQLFQDILHCNIGQAS